jgi:hypothetical protein
MADKVPTNPRLGDSYESGDAITGDHDSTSQELIKNTSPRVKVYDILSSGVAAEGTNQGTMFIAAGSLVVYTIDGSYVSVNHTAS